MGQIIKEAVKGNYAFWVTLITSIALMLIGFFLPWPPTGKIDGSIIAAVGELLAFGALGSFAKAIDKGLDARVKHGDTTIEVGDLNKDKDEE